MLAINFGVMTDSELSNNPLLTPPPIMQVMLQITPEQQMVWGDDNKWEVVNGRMQVDVGGQQPMQNTTAPSNIVTGYFTMASGP